MTYQIVSERRLRYQIRVQNPEDAYSLVKRYAKARREQFILICLNSANEAISVSFISVGIINRTIVHPREVFCKAIQDLATAIIICHNHPSGKNEPSTEDIELTKRLVSAGELLGIPVIDHLIISMNGFASLNSLGHIR